MKYLWLITTIMLGIGAALIVAGAVGLLGPIAFVAGVLLLWSAIVKVIVLRIWRSTLAAPAAVESAGRPHAAREQRLGQPG